MPTRCALVHEPLEVRERLCDREASSSRGEIGTEEGEREHVARLWLGRERRNGLFETHAVVLLQLLRATGRILDRLAVAGQRDPGRELDRAVECGEVVAERVGAAGRPETDGRRDPAEEVISRDEDAVAHETELPVRVAGRRDQLPAVDVLACLDENRVALVADERPVHRALPDELGRDVVGRALQLEPVDEPLRPRGVSPDELALRVVERALDDGRTGQLVQVGGCTDMVGMEVRDEDRRDAPTGFGEGCRPGLLCVGQADAGVDERPPGLAGQQIRVHVPRPSGQRQRDAADPVAELVHRATLAPCQDTNICSILDRVRVEYRIEPCKSALTQVRGMPFRWSLNPYMGCVHRCTFCYVRHFEKRADRPSDDRYGRSIRVKPNVAEVLRRELTRDSWSREEVALGTATDPYQPAEGKFRLTRACLVELGAAWTPYSIVTRGPLVVRDIDVLQEASAHAGAEVFLSLPTLDERVWRTTEPGTAPPASRLEAVRRLAAAGIDVGVGIAPILPGLSDDPEQLEAVVRAARAAGARTIWASVVHLRPGVREHFLEALARDWPAEVARYESLFAARAYLGAATTAPILEPVRRATAAVSGRRRRPPRKAAQQQLAFAV